MLHACEVCFNVTEPQVEHDLRSVVLWSLPQVVPATEDEVGFGVEGGADLAQAAVATRTLQAVFMPVFVQRLEQVAVFNLAVTASAALLFAFGLDGEHRHSCKR